MRPVVDPGPTCDDGSDHVWADATADIQRLYREPVAKTCQRCARAVSPKHVENIQKALRNRANRNDRLATFFESIGDDLIAAAQARSGGDPVTAWKKIADAGRKLRQGAELLRQ